MGDDFKKKVLVSIQLLKYLYVRYEGRGAI